MSDREVWQTTLQTRGYSMCCDELEWGGEGGKKMTPDQLEAESRAGTPDSNKRSSTGSNSGNNLVVRQLAAAILQVYRILNTFHFPLNFLFQNVKCKGEKEILKNCRTSCIFHYVCNRRT